MQSTIKEDTLTASASGNAPEAGRADKNSAQYTAEQQQKQIDALTHYLALYELSRGWVKNLGSLALAELGQSIQAFNQSLFLKLLLLPMILLTYLGASVAFSYAAATIPVVTTTDAWFIGLATFTLLQAVGIGIIVMMRKNLKERIGFTHTATQLREARNAIAQQMQ
ncbi:hypothetical protein KO528_18750 [Saccharophagus degradans]|uniref:hypothetical protein n=1 Tax=Saccharophagus degradans TaxID=86304 RepID=UPI001C08A71C|nr:hypothetical protein [Saccharophagus degradans]MBU2987409.1 hypothetical protein [Saccharophagus degradans]